MKEEKIDKGGESSNCCGSNNATGMGMMLGMTIGTLVGVALDQLGIWMTVGMCLGIVVGGYIDRRKRRQ